MTNNGYASNNRQQAYASRSFSRMKLEESKSAENPALPLRNVTFLRELCLGQPSEVPRSPEEPVDASGKANLLTDWSTADRLTEAVCSEAGTRYGDAVGRCLHCEFAFRQAVCNGLVTALEEDIKLYMTDTFARSVYDIIAYKYSMIPSQITFIPRSYP